MTDLTETFRKNLPRHADVDEITARYCTSDNFDGVEYKFYGEYVPVKPIIDVVSDADGMAIESIAHSGVGDISLTVFVAEIPQTEFGVFI